MKGRLLEAVYQLSEAVTGAVTAESILRYETETAFSADFA